MNMKSLVSTKRRKMLLASIVMLAIVCAATAAYADYMLTSNIIHVTAPKYTLTLSAKEDDDTLNVIDLNATVVGPSVISVKGLSVHFWVSINGGAWTEIPSSPVTTDAFGKARITYTLSGAGPWDFKATINEPFIIS